MLPITALMTNSRTVSSMRNMLVSGLGRGTALTEPLRATSRPTVMQPARSRRHLISHGYVLRTFLYADQQLLTTNRCSVGGCHISPISCSVQVKLIMFSCFNIESLVSVLDYRNKNIEISTILL